MTPPAYEPNVVLSTQEYSVVGTRPIRHDGADKVTGRALYGADVQPTGLLHGKILRSPHAHARIKSIDTSKAEALPGVRAVLTAADLPDAGTDITVNYGEGDMDLALLRHNVLAEGKVLYAGHAIAGVAATNTHVAEEALGLIEVEYEVLPSVTTATEGMANDAPIILEGLKTQELGEAVDGATNVAEHFQHSIGDLDQGFEQADTIIEREFNTAMVHQGYIEPQNVTALWNNDGRLHIWTSTQGPFEVRGAVAASLDLDVSRVKVTPMEIGGGFGGKFPLYHDPVAALLSKKTGQPVKIVMSRKEVFESTGPSSGSTIKIKMGSTSEGKITAAYAWMAYEAGAYPGSPVGAGAECVFTPYDIPNVVIDGYDVIVNKPKAGAYRAPGATNAGFAAETVVDELAIELGLDPIDFRLMNSAREGTRRASGPIHPRVGMVETLEAMKAHPHWNTPLDGPNRGRGVGVAFWMNGGGETSCTISTNPDGTINLTEGSADIGGTRASAATMAAEVLGISVEDVHPAVVDTDSTGYTSGTGGSSVTFKLGWSTHEAAQDLKSQMIQRAGAIWNVDADSVTLEDGVFQSKTDSELRMTFQELAAQLNGTGGPIVGRAALNASGVGAAFGGCIADVEVDPETGKVDILRFTIVQDAGKAILPGYVEGQMQGGAAQGIGWALNEEYYMSDDGLMQNTSLLDYRMPTSLDLPMIDTVIVEVTNPGHPFGVRGVGEVPIVSPPAAIANAIHNAVGVRMDVLPMNPGAVMDAIWKQGD
ncbi:MAG: xanthine dehydrogenase family protein molybdopterin-binding subunit [SAR202 cluster bacterium]|nr:xanthine dehydrogenase family protein molybdopterin-binding subunit [SAR202 cluster bacterium]